eukprot:5225930-Pleurochrysis_carterae.AAC.2
MVASAHKCSTTFVSSASLCKRAGLCGLEQSRGVEAMVVWRRWRCWVSQRCLRWLHSTRVLNARV